MGDRLGTLGAVGNTSFFALSTESVSQYEQQVALGSTELLLHTWKLQNGKASLQILQLLPMQDYCSCKCLAKFHKIFVQIWKSD